MPTIYQSMWFKPYLFDKSKDAMFDSSRNLGGWTLKRHFYMAWALSLYRLKTYYKDLVLVTDEIGYDLFINKLNFPYTEVDTSLEKLENNYSLWAIGKLEAYGKAKNDFLHLDGDVFIWKKIQPFKVKNELIVQNFEYNQEFYKSSLVEIEKYFDFIPNEIYKIVKSKKNIISFNAGTFGSNNIDFIKEYKDKAIEFVNKNKNCLENVDISRFNTVYEQLFCYYLAKKRDVKITPLFKERSYSKNDINSSKLYSGALVNFFEIEKMNYIHPLANFKKSLIIAYQIEKLLEYEFPSVYKKIIELEKNNLLI